MTDSPEVGREWRMRASAALASPDWEARTNTLVPTTFVTELERQLGGFGPSSNEQENARRFFAAMDLEANPFLLRARVARGEMSREDADQRRGAIDRLAVELRSRVTRRCVLMAAGDATSARLTNLAAAGLIGVVRMTSGLLLGLMDAYFPSDAAISQAFADFANGELRLVLPSGVVAIQPSSANYFLFGEFAAVAEELGIDAARWRQLAPVLAWTQHIFARVYAPARAATATFETYRGCDYALNGRPFSVDEIRRLARTNEAIDTRDALARHAALYLPGLAASSERSPGPRLAGV